MKMTIKFVAIINFFNVGDELFQPEKFYRNGTVL